jgi:hypothetical protein
MRHGLRKLVVLVALLALPAQGIAASLAVLSCHGSANLHALRGGGGAAAHDGAASDEEAAGAIGAYHLCCHHTAFAPLGANACGAPCEPLARVVALDPLRDLLVPELPDRPPLA